MSMRLILPARRAGDCHRTVKTRRPSRNLLNITNETAAGSLTDINRRESAAPRTAPPRLRRWQSPAKVRVFSWRTPSSGGRPANRYMGGHDAKISVRSPLHPCGRQGRRARGRRGAPCGHRQDSGRAGRRVGGLLLRLRRRRRLRHRRCARQSDRRGRLARRQSERSRDRQDDRADHPPRKWTRPPRRPSTIGRRVAEAVGAPPPERQTTRRRRPRGHGPTPRHASGGASR